jgi:hypothetical protein
MSKATWAKPDWQIEDGEGWALFNVETRPEIQRDDEADVFASDEDAIAFVADRAKDGSDPHLRALALHYGVDEYAEVD